MFIRPLSSLRERVIESYRRFELESKLRWRSIAASNYKRGSDGALSTLRIGNEAPLSFYHRFELKSRLRWRLDVVLKVDMFSGEKCIINIKEVSTYA